MEYMGLFHKYKVNRLLTDKERERQLDPKVKLEVQPIHQLTVLRMNSTYLETVDKYDAWRGWVTIMLLGCMGAFLYLVAGIIGLFSNPSAEQLEFNKLYQLDLIIIICVALLAVASIFYWLFLKEAFTWCYYPIRFNRKTRKVHVTRLNGTVLTVGWDEVFFTLSTTGMGSLGASHWEIQGHVLGEDRETVKETFALALWDMGHQAHLKQYWEYIRCYMEEGPEALLKTGGGRHDQYLPVLFQRETWWFAARRFLFNWHGYSLIPLLAFPLFIATVLGRQIALRSSRLPKWPAEVEAECVIEPGDPYERDARHNKHDLWGMKVWPSQKPLW